MTLVPPVKLDKEEYRLVHTLVFFRSGIGGWIKEQRENKIGSVLAWLPSWTVPGNCHIRGAPPHTLGSAPTTAGWDPGGMELRDQHTIRLFRPANSTHQCERKPGYRGTRGIYPV